MSVQASGYQAKDQEKVMVRDGLDQGQEVKHRNKASRFKMATPKNTVAETRPLRK